MERAAGWDVSKAPVLGDHAYGENTWLRDRLDQAGCQYVLWVGATTKWFAQATVFAVHPRSTRHIGRIPTFTPTARPSRSVS